MKQQLAKMEPRGLASFCTSHVFFLICRPGHRNASLTQITGLIFMVRVVFAVACGVRSGTGTLQSSGGSVSAARALVSSADGVWRQRAELNQIGTPEAVTCSQIRKYEQLEAT